MSEPLILQVAIDTPLYRLFDYLPLANASVTPGCRVLVPFGRKLTVGMVIAVSSHSDFPAHKLKRVIEVLDPLPLIPDYMLRLINWAADYYQHPIGEVVAAAIPKLLREGKPLDLSGDSLWQLTATGKQPQPSGLQRAPKQAALRDWLLQHGAADTESLADFSDNWRTIMTSLVEKGLAEKHIQPCLESHHDTLITPPQLNAEQIQAVTCVEQGWGQFRTYLLHGITGSGKTEVYLALTETAIAKGMQVLILVPEINLTPQLTRRFRQRLAKPIAALHSGLNDRQRQCAWGMAAKGEAQVVIGTRSALFTPMPRLGLIIIDEEHDASLKQQEGFRYHARDLALVRAKQASIPVLLGSATPSLESLYNAERGQYLLLQLRQRAALAKPPTVQVLDVRRRPLQDGLSDMLLQYIRNHLEQQGQVLLFLNRRGYAPLLMCHECGWQTDCPRCDAHMTLHQHSRRLHCHHCGHEKPAPDACPQCGHTELWVPGTGTERIEHALNKLFPDITISRIDRDTTRRKGALHDKLEQARSGEAQILIGTQMLAKGHDFPNVSLVGILDADQGLFSSDFRGAEHLAQLIIQVAGRAGRAERAGEVFIQTHQPDHPLLLTLLNQGYYGFAQAALAERRASTLPPFSHLAILRAEATKADDVTHFLRQAKQQLPADKLEVFGPLTAPMARRAGRQRMQLVVQAAERRELHQQLHNWVRALAQIKGASKVRWSVDVDPVDLY
jgi:primosomal protein N' (replication factor Y)